MCRWFGFTGWWWVLEILNDKGHPDRSGPLTLERRTFKLGETPFREDRCNDHHNQHGHHCRPKNATLQQETFFDMRQQGTTIVTQTHGFIVLSPGVTLFQTSVDIILIDRIRSRFTMPITHVHDAKEQYTRHPKR